VGSARDRHSIHKEPHRQSQPLKPDAAEEKVERLLAGERAGRDPDEERAKHSVFDEPAVLPNRPSVLIERDWSCRNCGYNLRGLMTGHRCPECGCIELYEPPREGELTYAQWLAEHEDRASPGRSWLIAASVPFIGIPFAVFCAFFVVEHLMLLNFVVLGPAVSEGLKIAVTLILLERWGLVVRCPGQIHLMTLGTAVVFAAIQNVVYLLVYFTNSPVELVVYRWAVGLPLHGLCTLIAARGLILVWERAQHERRAASVTTAYPYVGAAIVLHAVFNLCVFVRGDFGYGF
jgi:hypothetical protein